jgi:hypothetical protein
VRRRLAVVVVNVVGSCISCAFCEREVFVSKWCADDATGAQHCGDCSTYCVCFAARGPGRDSMWVHLHGMGDKQDGDVEECCDDVQLAGPVVL